LEIDDFQDLNQFSDGTSLKFVIKTLIISSVVFFTTPERVCHAFFYFGLTPAVGEGYEDDSSILVALSYSAGKASEVILLRQDQSFYVTLKIRRRKDAKITV